MVMEESLLPKLWMREDNLILSYLPFIIIFHFGTSDFVFKQ